jgi:hypothetical protein
MARKNEQDGIRVALSFYDGPLSREQTVWERMPQIPQAGDTVHYNPDHDDMDGSRAWRVLHVAWVCDDFTRNVWHAEIGLD